MTLIESKALPRLVDGVLAAVLTLVRTPLVRPNLVEVLGGANPETIGCAGLEHDPDTSSGSRGDRSVTSARWR